MIEAQEFERTLADLVQRYPAAYASPAAEQAWRVEWRSMFKAATSEQRKRADEQLDGSILRRRSA